VSLTVQIGDVIRLSVIGNVLTVYQNRVSKLSITDSTYNGSILSGTPGFYLYVGTGSITASQISLWAGGTP
jgi:hypothetical protein